MEKQTIAVVVGDSQKRKENKIRVIMMELLFSGFLLAGGSVILGNILFSGNGVPLFAVGMASAALILIGQRSEKGSIILPLLLLTAAVVVLFWQLEGVIQGTLFMIDTILSRWNMVFDTYYPLYGIQNASQENIFSAAIIMGIFLGTVISYSIWNKWMYFLTFVVYFLIFFGGLLRVPSYYAYLFLLAGWMGSFTGNTVEHHQERKIGVIICILALLAGGVCTFFLSGYRPSTLVDTFKTQIKDTVYQLRYGKDSLPKGDLTRAGALLKKSEMPALQLSFDTLDEMYLRGFVGAEYEGQKWTTLDNEAYMGRQEGMLEWLDSRQYHPVFAYAACMEEGGNEEYLHSQTIRVVNSGADRKYVYVPASVQKVEETDYRANQDWQLVSNSFLGAGNYQFDNLDGNSPTELMEKPTWMSEGETVGQNMLIQSEGVYRSFVYSYYLDLDDTMREKIDRLFFSGESWTEDQKEDTADIYNTTSRIRAMLSAMADYQPVLDEVPEGKDFVTWFLEEKKVGNAVHFATAAVLAYRAAGIPARYAEGYYVSRELAETLTINGADTCQLNESNGHAWAEIYVDGIGWSPVEVTPGFYSEYYMPDKIIDAQEKEVEGGGHTSKIEADEVFSGSGKKAERPETEKILWSIPGLCVFFILLIFLLFILLELQRFFRLLLKRCRMRRHPDRMAEMQYAAMCHIFFAAGIQEDFRYPYALTDRVTNRFSSVKKEEYIRVIQIIQKNVFGLKELRPNEQRILYIFCMKLKKNLYKNAGPVARFHYRYICCL